MWNNLIAVLLTFGFYKRATTEIEEKTDNASWWRVFIYLVLTILVLAFYVKSYSIAHVINMVQIDALKGSPTDTIKSLYFFSTLKPDSYSYGDQIELKLADSIAEPMSGKSGASFSIAFGGDSIRENPNYKTLTDSLKRYDSTGGLYGFSYAGSHIKSFSPFLEVPTTIETPVQYPQNQNFTYDYTLCEKFGSNYTQDFLRGPDGKPVIPNMSGDDCYQFLWRSNKNKYRFHTTAVSSELINAFGFLTAADLSQCIISTTMKTNIPIEELGFIFDMPVEVTAFPGDYENRMTEVIITDTTLLKELYHTCQDSDKQVTLQYHVKFPTMANLQLVRSLILTTILTAVVALLFSNLYYCARRFVMRRKDTKNDKASRSIEDKRIRHYRRVVRIISAVFYFIILAYAIMIYTDTRIETAVPIWLCWAIVAAIGAALLAAAVYARKKLIR